MMTTKINIEAKLQDTDAARQMCLQAVAAALGKIKEIERLVADIRDPVNTALI